MSKVKIKCDSCRYYISPKVYLGDVYYYNYKKGNVAVTDARCSHNKVTAKIFNKKNDCKYYIKAFWDIHRFITLMICIGILSIILIILSDV